MIVLVLGALLLALRPWNYLVQAAAPPANGSLVVLVTGNCEGTLENCG